MTTNDSRHWTSRQINMMWNVNHKTDARRCSTQRSTTTRLDIVRRSKACGRDGLASETSAAPSAAERRQVAHLAWATISAWRNGAQAHGAVWTRREKSMHIFGDAPCTQRRTHNAYERPRPHRRRGCRRRRTRPRRTHTPQRPQRRNNDERRRDDDDPRLYIYDTYTHNETAETTTMDNRRPTRHDDRKQWATRRRRR